jgi:predicted RNA-binding protein YlqC (UPF0109 family)
MNKLLQFILENVVDKDDFVLDEEVGDSGVNMKIKVNKEKIGLVIGKGGKTIKALQDILRVKSKLENTNVFLTVEEKIN